MPNKYELFIQKTKEKLLSKNVDMRNRPNESVKQIGT